MEASPRGIAWPEYPPDNKEGWERINRVADFFQPHHETVGAGISEADPRYLIGYRYPIITTYARQPEDEVYALIKARSEEHTSELQSLMRTSYAVFCLKKKKMKITDNITYQDNT